ncbi:NADPH-dependent F420 reductase [Streptomyces sp. NPDC007355]|uniref:NADPH-dependent F420 reductase n=1 Tax=Streptomyces sp. NPDC007355 TaxID=3364778 RepID=UPI0036A017D0
MKISIIGAGNVGSVLAQRFSELGHLVAVADTSTGSGRIAAEVGEADVIVLAVPFAAVAELDATVKQGLVGKTVIDATNPLAADFMSLTVGHTTSGAEQVAAALPGALIVKAFSSILAPNHGVASLGDQPLFLPVASDHDGAKQAVLDLAVQLGYDAVDAGPLANARYIEPTTELLIQLAYGQGHGTGIALALARA